jgi:hypothetical protein
MSGTPDHIKAAEFTRELTRPDYDVPAKNSYVGASDIGGYRVTWIENPWGWVVFFGVIGMGMVGMPTKGWLGAVIGAAVFGATLAVLAFVVGGKRVQFKLPRPRTLGPWPAWTIGGLALGVTAGFGLAAGVDVLDEPDALLLRGIGIVAAGFAVLATLVRLALGLFFRRGRSKASVEGAEAPPSSRYQRRSTRNS